jgi:hypothetical protein
MNSLSDTQIYIILLITLLCVIKFFPSNASRKEKFQKSKIKSDLFKNSYELSKYLIL